MDQALPDYRPDPQILGLGEPFYDPVAAASFPQSLIRFRNDRAAATVGLDPIDDERWRAHFGRFEPLRDNLPIPLALRYHGHQFRHYNPDLGDGRGFLFAQLRDSGGRLMDLGTKGSGQTPWSRFGDGRLTLKGGVREVLATETLSALGVETSLSLSLIETGEALDRGDEPSPTRSSVLVRLSHGHIRIGTFQRLAWHRDADAMRRLTRYVLVHLYDEHPADDADAAHRLLNHVVGRTARLAASYMAAGFVHGVLNTDNINVTGESFDYGPWRFAPSWDPGFTAAYFDHAGLYAFGRQPEAIGWNVAQLAAALRLIGDEQALIATLDRYPAAYRDRLAEAVLWRLGVRQREKARDAALLVAIERGLMAERLPIDRFFFDCFGGSLPHRLGAGFDTARELLTGYAPRATRRHPYWQDPAPCGMSIAEVEAIWAAIDTRDDWAPFDAKIAAIRTMGSALATG